MRGITMELRTLKYFITIAECQNFSKASKLQHISQPTLSRQIAYLEEELGVTLFIRTKPNIKLTQAGELCLEKSRDIKK
jgi:DNA-binding transcriptional LysR family regulator